MKLVDVRFDWVPSVSDDVISTKFYLSQDGENLVSATLGADANSYIVEGLSEKTTYFATVVVSDGMLEATTSVEVVIGDLTAPMPVTGLVYTVLGIYDPEVNDGE
jgi:hypothetical protein